MKFVALFAHVKTFCTKAGEMKPSKWCVRACLSAELLFQKTKTVVCKDAFLSFQLRIFVAPGNKKTRRKKGVPKCLCVYILSVRKQKRARWVLYIFIFAGTRGKKSAASGGESLSAAPFVMLIRAIVWRAPLLTFIYLSAFCHFSRGGIMQTWYLMVK